jgi:hypothetical protein
MPRARQLLEARFESPCARDSKRQLEVNRQCGSGGITRDRSGSPYGQHQSVELLSCPERGTLARVCIPFIAQTADDSQHSLVVALCQTG